MQKKKKKKKKKNAAMQKKKKSFLHRFCIPKGGLVAIFLRHFDNTNSFTKKRDNYFLEFNKGNLQITDMFSLTYKQIN